MRWRSISSAICAGGAVRPSSTMMTSCCLVDGRGLCNDLGLVRHDRELRLQHRLRLGDATGSTLTPVCLGESDVSATVALQRCVDREAVERPVAARGLEFLTRSLIEIEQPEDGVGETLDVLRPREESDTFERFAHATDVGRDDRLAAHERLDDRVGNASEMLVRRMTSPWL